MCVCVCVFVCACVCVRVCVCRYIYVLVTYYEGKKSHIWRKFSYYLSIILQPVHFHTSSITSITPSSVVRTHSLKFN